MVVWPIKGFVMRNLNEIQKYVNTVVLPQYKSNDDAHNVEHVKYVIKRSLKFSKQYNCDSCIVYVAAAYHDIGHSINPDNHEKVSAEIFEEDTQIKKWFSKNEINLISEAIQDHRASDKQPPRSIYGEIISSADRTINVVLAIKRSVRYNMYHFGCENQERIVSNVYSYIINKYGETGYSKTYVKDKQYYKFNQNMIFLSKHPTFLKILIKLIFIKILYIENNKKIING